MSKFQIKEFLKASIDITLVLLQFFIIFLHFLRFEFPPNIEIIPENSIFIFFGCLIIILASFAILMAIKDLGRNLSPLPRPKASGYLITSGIYGLMRHPMYYSLILISFGIFLIKLSFYYLCLTIILGFIIKFKIIVEEQYLKNKFKTYFLYKEKVK